MPIRLILTLFGFTLAVPPMFLAGAGEPTSSQGGPAAGARHDDPVAGILPFTVLKTYQELFPGHQLWRVAQTGKDKDAEFELIIFHPQSTGSHGQQIGPAHVTTLMNYKLVVKGTGAVIQEQAHPIAASTVPKAVKQAADEWKRPLQGRNFFVDWMAHQDVGAERLYSIYIELNAIEAYRATLKADGTFVKGAKAFENYKPKQP